METLLELASVVTRNKVKEIRTLKRCSCSPKEKVHEFYELLTEGAFTTDEEAAKVLGYPDKKDPAYRKLKNQLEERLLNSVPFIDVRQPDFSDAQKAFYTCQRYVALCKILLGREAKKPAVKLLKKILNYSERLELSESAHYAAKNLCSHYAFRTGEIQKFEKYLNLTKKYSRICRAEEIALHCWQQYSVISVRSVQGENQDLFEKMMQHLLPYLSSVNSYQFRFCYYSLITKHLALSVDHTKMIDTCTEALVYFKSKPMAPILLYAIFYIRQLEAYVNLDDSDSAQEIFQKCDRDLESGSVNWYNAYELYIIMLFRRRKYETIKPSLQKVLQHPTYRHQRSKRHETCRIILALLHYLSLLGKVKTEANKKFRFRKFLNEIPIYSQDKRGHNITVLIIQILILIQTKKYDQLTDRIEAIEKYTSRYLRNDENFRSNCFIKMLLQVPKRNFHKVAVLRHAKPYIEKLATVPLLESKGSYEIEIIPYEHLWEYVLESLG